MADDDVVEVSRARWEAMEARMGQLEAALGLRGGEGPGSATDGRTDRRGLLKHGAMLAAGALAGGTALAATQVAPASASTGGMQYGTLNNAGADQTDLVSGSVEYVMALHMTCTEGTGSCLQLDDGQGGATGTYGGGFGYLLNAAINNKASSFPAIIGSTNGSGCGIEGYGPTGVCGVGDATGVLGQSASSGAGVLGNDDYQQDVGVGIGIGVKAQISNPNNGSPALQALTAGTGGAIDAAISNGSNANPAVFGSTVGSGPAVWGQQLSGLSAAGVYGDSYNSGGPGVQGVSGNTGVAGVLGQGLAGPGVQAETLESFNASPAVLATTVGTGPAVQGQITNATSTSAALSGITNGTGSAIVGQVNNTANTQAGLLGITNGTGPAVGAVATGAGAALSGLVYGGTGSPILGQIINAANTQPGVAATTNGTGPAVQGIASGAGIGINASSKTGRGAVLAGGAAQAKLTPSTAASHPTSGQAGDLFVDSSARLWFCKVGGTSATWTQIA
jgi:hypothetical protein